MALMKIAAASLLLVVRASEASSDTCTSGDCLDEESSLLALRASKGHDLSKWFARFNKTTCRNKEGLIFACGDGECCGNVCKAKGDHCCENSLGDDFPCGGKGECCGNACAGQGSKCCNKGFFQKGYEYPVAKGTACTSESVTCTNSDGAKFQCGADSSCCGDICVGPGGTCCKSGGVGGFTLPFLLESEKEEGGRRRKEPKSHNFVCGPKSKCCGNSCQAPGSKCCQTKGLNYPVTKATKCAGWNSGSVQCHNRYGNEFLCGAKSSCCGDMCAGEGGVCCQNVQGTDFVCGKGSKCGKNVCLAD